MAHSHRALALPLSDGVFHVFMSLFTPSVTGGLFTQVNVEVQVQATNRLLLPMRKSVAITES